MLGDLPSESADAAPEHDVVTEPVSAEPVESPVVTEPPAAAPSEAVAYRTRSGRTVQAVQRLHYHRM